MEGLKGWLTVGLLGVIAAVEVLRFLGVRQVLYPKPQA